MSERIEALKKSIQHWVENVEAKTPDDASSDGGDCALCRYYVHICARGGELCPVYVEALQYGCHGTPWGAADHALHKWRNSPTNSKTMETWRKAAQAEVDFLNEILEKGFMLSYFSLISQNTVAVLIHRLPDKVCALAYIGLAS